MEKIPEATAPGNLRQTLSLHGPMTRKVMQRNAWRDVANLRIIQLSNYSKSQRHAWMTINLKKKKLDQLESCQQFAHKLFWNVCTRHVLVDPIFYVLWTKFARSITKWTNACDKRLSRLISYIHHTYEFKHYCHVGITAQQRRLGLFQDSGFVGDKDDSKSTSGGLLCIFGSHTFVPISRMCKKKKNSVSHNGSWGNFSRCRFRRWLDFRIRSLDLVIEVFHSSSNQTNKTKDDREPRGNPSAKTQPNMRKQIPTMHTNLDLTNVDHVPSNGTHSGPMLCCISLRTMKLWFKKAGVPQWDMYQEPTELLWIGCLTGLILILKFRFYTLTPNINSQQTIWPKVISHVANGTTFFTCSTSAISAPLAALRIPAW